MITANLNERTVRGGFVKFHVRSYDYNSWISRRWLFNFARRLYLYLSGPDFSVEPGFGRRNMVVKSSTP